MPDTDLLSTLHADIDTRVKIIRDAHPDWPCAKGCDRCCRHLAGVPRLTAPEWALLRDALAALPPETFARIAQRIAALSGGNAAAPVVCPMLDLEAGACPVYAGRPVACRTYGFYVERALGLHCGDIGRQVEGGALADVVWGNHDAVARRLDALGDARPLTEWFAGWDRGPAAVA